MLVGGGDLPRSGASRCIQGRAYADLDGSLRRLSAANAARLERETGRAISLWASRLDDPNQVCVVAWGTIKKGSAGALISHDDNMACEGVTASSRFWSSQRALLQPAQSIPDSELGEPAGDASRDGTVRRHCACIIVFRNMTCSPGLADDSSVRTQCHRALHVRMPKSKWQNGRAARRDPHALTAGYDRPAVGMFQNTPLFPVVSSDSVSGEEVVERSSEDAVEWIF